MISKATNIIKKSLYILVKVFFVCILIFIFLIILLRVSSELREKDDYQSIAPYNIVGTKYGDIHYQDIGAKDGIPIIFVHGTGAWSEIWKNVSLFLEESGYRSIAIDLPPFGFSEKIERADYTKQAQAEKINEVLKELKLNKVILVGHSFGSGPVVEFSLKYSEKVEKLVLVDPALSFEQEYLERNRILESILDKKWIRNTIVSVFVTNPWLTETTFKSLVFKKESVTQKQIDIAQQQLSVEKTTETVGDWLQYFIFSKENDLGSLSSVPENYMKASYPVLLLWGKEDTITPLEQGKYLKSIMPTSQLIVLSKVGHIPHVENAQLFNETLLRFLSQ